MHTFLPPSIFVSRKAFIKNISICRLPWQFNVWSRGSCCRLTRHSRQCGMIYMEPAAIVFDSLVISSLDTFPCSSFHLESPCEYSSSNLESTCTVKFVRKNLVETVLTVDNNLARGCFHLLESIFLDYAEKRKIHPFSLRSFIFTGDVQCLVIQNMSCVQKKAFMARDITD